MDFEDLIETLTKGSASAVTTLESNVADLNALKKYLDVQTPVGAALRAEIDNNLKKPCVIFVCGSSGDRKSELYRRIYDSYGTKVRFHLNATHSFNPQKDAIGTLDDQFAAFVVHCFQCSHLFPYSYEWSQWRHHFCKYQKQIGLPRILKRSPFLIGFQLLPVIHWLSHEGLCQPGLRRQPQNKQR